MKPVAYACPATVGEACRILEAQGPGACVLAGGTDLLLKLRRPLVKRPEAFVDISRVEELKGIGENNGEVCLGPLATHSELARSAALRRFAPLLAAAAETIGSPQNRNRGTVGGNIMNAAACADTVPALIALRAAATLQSGAGRREMSLAELFVKPYQTRANPGELLAAVRFPKLPADARSAFLKLGRRNALSIARMSVAAVLRVGPDGRIAEARIVPGAVFETWRRAAEAERMLVGEKPAPRLFAAAGREVAEQMIKETGRRWSTDYKEPVIAVLVRRALEQCASAFEAPAGVSAPPGTGYEPRTAPSRGEGGGNPPATECNLVAAINGRTVSLTVPAGLTLLELLRDQLGLTGTKCGCEIGECGACTVLLDGEPVNACLVLAPQIAGREVTTVEGLAQGGRLHRLQEAFLDCDAVHCGFCTPGMLMSAKALLDRKPDAADGEIRAAICGNLCRCTGYQQIADAIAKAGAGAARPFPAAETAGAQTTPVPA